MENLKINFPYRGKSATQRGACDTKKERPVRPLRFHCDTPRYLRRLRCNTIAKAPTPSKLTVAGSGIGTTAGGSLAK